MEEKQGRVTRKKLKQKLERMKGRAFRESEMRKHFEELHKVGVGELHFEKKQGEFLLDILRDIEQVAKNDPLVCAVIENGKNKYELNKLTHIREIFGE